MWKPEDWNQLRDMNSEGPQWMDERHVRFMYEAAMACRWSHTLEIGVHDGWSASAFLQACLEGVDLKQTLCDPEYRPAARHLVKQHPKMCFLHTTSDHVDFRGFGCIVVDGSHETATVSREIGKLLAAETTTIIAHDVGTRQTSKQTHFGTAGAVLLREVLTHHPLFLVRHDFERRHGEFTERGFLFATRDAKQFYATEKPWLRMLGIA